MTNAAYGAVDWGTSSFRLWLMGADNSVLAERRSHEGMTTASKTGFASILEDHLKAVGAPEDLPVIICGMAGARQGWVEAGYIDTPAALTTILTAAVRVPNQQRDIRILPGLAQRDPEKPDVMRGEETQLLGALDPTVTSAQSVCMPGTHSKWVHLHDAKVNGFATFMTGELFEAVTHHTILSHAVAGAQDAPFDHDSFEKAVSFAFHHPALATNIIFTARSGQLLHGLTAAAAQARISGTLIGLEIAGGLGKSMAKPEITLVASGRLKTLYEMAFQALSFSVTLVDADDAVRRGLSAAASALWSTEKA